MNKALFDTHEFLNKHMPEPIIDLMFAECNWTVHRCRCGIWTYNGYGMHNRSYDMAKINASFMQHVHISLPADLADDYKCYAESISRYQNTIARAVERATHSTMCKLYQYSDMALDNPHQARPLAVSKRSAANCEPG
jgi:hypothetical protein